MCVSVGVCGSVCACVWVLYNTRWMVVSVSGGASICKCICKYEFKNIVRLYAGGPLNGRGSGAPRT